MDVLEDFGVGADSFFNDSRDLLVGSFGVRE